MFLGSVGLLWNQEEHEVGLEEPEELFCSCSCPGGGLEDAQLVVAVKSGKLWS